MSETFRTITGRGRAEHKVEGSRFVAEAFPVVSPDEAGKRIDDVREREHKATHHCWAFRVGTEGDTFRYNDDGEPSGTAGAPILRQLDARELTDTLVVVTRFYGGTKLGTGGLARAYRMAASDALERAHVVERVVRIPVCIRFAYDDTSPVEQVLQQFDTEVEASEYTDVTMLTVGVPRSEVEAFVEAFTNALSDRGKVVRIGHAAED